MTAPATPSPKVSRLAETFIALGWTILFFVIGYGLTTAIALGYAYVFGTPGHRLDLLSQPGPAALLLQGISTILGFGISTWLVGIKAAHLNLKDLRWQAAWPASRGFLIGLLLGFVPALVALSLAVGLGHARFVADGGTFAQYLSQAGLTFLALAPAALSEEIVFRGVPQVLFSRPLGRAGAVAVLSVLFGAAHLLNPHVEPLALANIALAGAFLAAAFYLPGGIWTAFGAHLGWNFTLAAADAPVSGLPFTIPWINYLPGGPDWVTGGPFGPEGGLVASAAILLALTWTIRRIRREDS